MHLILSLSLPFILLLSSVSINAQVNTYFQNNPSWQVQSSCAVPYPCIRDETYQYYITGDTIINSLTYKMIFRKGIGEYMWFAPPPVGCSGSYSYIDTAASFFLRSFDKQMYVRFPADTTEHLLYDFDLAIGDTLPVTYNNFQNDITVSGIDSFYTPYGYLKRFELTGAQFLLEGVGNANGLIEPLAVILECGYTLNCFSLNDSSWFPSSGLNCDVAVGKAHHEFTPALSVFPNPFNNEAVILLNTNLLKARLCVFNSLGQIVIETENIAGSKITFRRNNLTAGIYFVTVAEGNKKYSGKFLIID